MDERLNQFTPKHFQFVMSGWTPLAIEKGVYCLGCPGPSYPQPSTLVAPGFQPYNYRSWTADATTLGFGTLGMGNPSILWNSPGHLIGLIDTYNRAAFGISILAAMQNAPEVVSPVDANISVAIGDCSVGATELYVNGDRPDDYLFKIDPEKDAYWHQTSYVDPKVLMGGATTFGYVGIADDFRDSMAALSSAASSLSGLKVFYRLSPASTYLPDEEWMDVYWYEPVTTFDGQCPGPLGPIGWYDDWITLEGEYYTRAFPATADQAMTIAYGAPGFHENSPLQYEYRTLTELNGAANVCPVVAYGYRGWCRREETWLGVAAMGWTIVEATFEVCSPSGGMTSINVFGRLTNRTSRGTRYSAWSEVHGESVEPDETMGGGDGWEEITEGTMTNGWSDNSIEERIIRWSASVSNAPTHDQQWLGVPVAETVIGPIEKRMKVIGPTNTGFPEGWEEITEIGDVLNLPLSAGLNVIRIVGIMSMSAILPSVNFWWTPGGPSGYWGKLMEACDVTALIEIPGVYRAELFVPGRLDHVYPIDPPLDPDHPGTPYVPPE